MSSQALITIVIGIIGFLVFLFLWRRNSGIQHPHRLYLKKKSQFDNLPASMSREAQTASSFRPEGEKNLNVIFMFNGHTFDAHEVLGIPAGANRKMIDKAFQEMIKRVDNESQIFVKTAYEVLLSNLNQGN